MTWVLLAGAVTGLAAFWLVLRLDRGSGTAAAELARLDSMRHRSRSDRSLLADRRHQEESVRLRRFGAELSSFMSARGWELPASVRADLSVMGRSLEAHLAMSVLGALAGFLAPFVVVLPFALGDGFSITIPLWLSVVGALAGGLLTTAQLKSEAAERRRDFRHVVSAFLDLVAMNLAGGRGVPEALSAAAGVSEGWAMIRLRDTMESARLQGVTPWAALGELGEDMDVKELRDLAAALALVAEDGAKVRDSLSARAVSMRQRELADTESRAQEKSQSMLVAQLLLALGFLAFLVFPAVAQIIGI
ncbi:hypothetical protein D9V41_03625 [Aeromicrobium phragmitis]|uniref:Type II secretion system protein GspF domain-containing protein n=1 Tax=Aeromicrobium phragmitis TaxID=2478914 RepID=A0A3L8PSB9_9ACTN|nr:type II secretion system F family protein [Aeromicrobium phragmitis]RLV56872.1 hypothetical protein D9V41_03625 [Aeromicrobium phragmitis]